MKKNIYLYTGSFPYGLKTESFIGPELSIISTDNAYDITVIPVLLDSPLRSLPEGISLDNSICKANFLYKFRAFLSVFSVWTIYQTWKDRRNITKFKYLFHLIKYAYAANLVYIDVCSRAKRENSSVFYSYWMAYAPIAFSRYKYSHPHSSHRFVTRGHGGDVYTTDRGLYYPFREFALSKIDHVYVVSKYGRDYLRRKYPAYEDKITHAYLGVVPNKVENQKSSSCIKIVSCSSVYDFKRVGLLFRSLEKYASAHPDIKYEWTHFGGGYLFESLKKEVSDYHKQDNLSIILTGNVNNLEVLRNYRQNAYHVFVHVSTTEGLPVAIMEALASSIPVVSTAVGGIPEIVTSDTGQLLDVNFSQNDFDYSLSKVLDNVDSYSNNALCHYNRYFNAERNFKQFYKEISCFEIN